MQPRIAQFEKVSLEQFITDLGIEDKSEAERIYNNIAIPKRSTVGSAGYDFVSPIGFTLNPGEKIKIPTGIRCEMSESYGLFIAPRSSMGFKYHMVLDNTLGIIDSDYYYSENEGHIMAKITNMGDKPMTVNEGERFIQGVFIPFGITIEDNRAELELRTGGIGSTGV